MARADDHADDLSVQELIEGPTEVISAQELAAVRAARPAGAGGPGPAPAEQQELSGLTDDAAGGRAVVELPRLPQAGPLYRRALLGALPGVGRRRGDTLPGVELTVAGVTVDRAHLADYDRVCGFRLADRLPATYPHVMGFPLALRLMTGPEFPMPLAGLVHVANRITVHRPVEAGETLDFSAYAERLRPHDRGRQVDVVLVGSIGGEEVWRGVSTYLGKERAAGGGERRGPGERPGAPAATAHWRVTPRVGVHYARVSGDHNPIHTSRLGARLFGFPRPIAHGMWSKARCLAALENRLPEAYTVEVAFKLPVPLPSTVAFSVGADGPGWEFALNDARAGRPHLAGAVR
ncbi:MaoC family dehydratase [Micromonospora sp. RTGN7]|uniref:MaoC family dehydratase n=1 Tax=Micromonospora sp. RTGN7 TaxID=3016526 RepID=UPI0029FED675|nr:MaoC/PaaZ C-terminal domain-containing protein [Micromonospora sp. RTGN7]